MRGLFQLDGLDDKMLEVAIAFKAAHPNKFGFNPANRRPGPSLDPNRPLDTVYDCLTFTWSGSEGLSVMIDMLSEIAQVSERVESLERQTRNRLKSA